MPRHDPYKEEARRLARQREIEKDTVYFVRFVKKDCGYPVQYFSAIDGLVCDPEKNPETLERAIKTFEFREKVADWKEIADRYECSSYLYN